MSKRRICLSMIVKNESAVIRRCLAPVQPIINSWVICDTGSTEGTQEIIRDFARYDIPGELHDRPWQDSAHNRNQALALLEADDELELSADYRMPLLNVDYRNPA
ncbi:hypothetical protein [Bradyrhizobium sp. AUGA SZCCT0182]|uniref:hypothetical protein n=1 Tax=Bradyrhizobium sp. AUGA SZCCT0182 TaxID=2807667 RepID=UPI001BA5B867|nr:hypothetical protein [Bradyrhizobium sp. AUGA SZCCT0182]MBR1232873.1 hypothetical protein [Bradyrhizobium sp. AUGA SZCCT0182]